MFVYLSHSGATIRLPTAVKALYIDASVVFLDALDKRVAEFPKTEVWLHSPTDLKVYSDEQEVDEDSPQSQ